MHNSVVRNNTKSAEYLCAAMRDESLEKILLHLGIDKNFIYSDWVMKTIKKDLLHFAVITLNNSMYNDFKDLEDRAEKALTGWNVLKREVEKHIKYKDLGLKLIFFVLLAKIHFYTSIIPKSLLEPQKEALSLHKANTLYLQEIRAFVTEYEKTIRKLSLYNFLPLFEREYIRVLVTVKEYKSLQDAFKPINIVDLVEEFINNESNAETRKQFFSYIQLNLAHCSYFKHKHKNITVNVALNLWNELYKNVLKRVIGKGLLLPELEVIYFIWSAKIHFYTLISNKKEANTAYFIAIKNFVKNYRGINGDRFKVYSLLPTDDAVIFAVLTKNFNDAYNIAKKGKWTNGIGNYVPAYFSKKSNSLLSDEVKNTIKKHFEIIKKLLNVHSCYKFKSFIATFCQIIQQPTSLSAKEQIPPKKVA